MKAYDETVYGITTRISFEDGQAQLREARAWGNRFVRSVAPRADGSFIINYTDGSQSRFVEVETD